MTELNSEQLILMLLIDYISVLQSFTLFQLLLGCGGGVPYFSTPVMSVLAVSFTLFKILRGSFDQNVNSTEYQC